LRIVSLSENIGHPPPNRPIECPTAQIRSGNFDQRWQSLEGLFSSTRFLPKTMKRLQFLSIAIALPTLLGYAHAQEVVTPSPNAEALFSSPDPQLHANKQVAYQIIRELLEAGRWDRADRYLTERYIQHNPNAQSGRDAVVQYFTGVLKIKPRAIPERISTPIVAVTAEADLVTVLYPRTVNGPDGRYTTTWFDTWRIRDGKADEHWDPALKGESPDLSR
jgi:predicted SnoaL-like aldol condensation-catalyzing enzyme